MVQKRKTGRKVQTKTKPSLSLRRLLPVVLVCIFVVLATVISVRAIQQHNQKVREQQAQLTRLNATADDLKKVYDQLLATLPNIKEHSFTKSCGQSSDVLNNGTITCGTRVYLEQPISDKSINELFKETLNTTVGKKEFVLKSQKQGISYSTGQPAFEAVLVSVNTQISCNLSEAIYDPAQYKTRFGGSSEAPEKTIMTTDISCVAGVKSFLPGYIRSD